MSFPVLSRALHAAPRAWDNMMPNCGSLIQPAGKNQEKKKREVL
jgi:hypothetical protein